ncbi:MAG: RES domain-containing protein [Thermoleophilia bacterium]|nr:RES domain-containing protein [Thermoleophilia bacterium]
MIVYRCFAWNRRAAPRREGGALWIPREHQGDGRHDNPDAYGCLYATDREASSVVEQLAPWRGQRLAPELLVRRGLPLAVAALELPDDAELLDLDEPRTLARERLRPSRVATRERAVTQPQALELFTRHPDAAGLRWWSTYESLWANYTLFDRAGGVLRVEAARALTPDDEALVEAAAFLGLG